MRDSDLNAFLASVRRTRFVDYLDPLGETAQNAFDRRLSWARVSQHDPAYADEARFLLDNAEALREVLRRELEEDDWIEEADVGREWETRPSRAIRMRENDRVTEIFQADEVEIGLTGRRPVSGRGRSGADPRRTGPSAAGRDNTGARSARSVVSTPPPRDERRIREGRIGRSTPEPAPPTRRSVGRSPEVARRSDIGADLVSDGGSRGRQRAPGRVGSRGASSIPPERGVPRPRERSLDLVGRSNPGSPAPSALGRWQTPMRAEVTLEEDDATTPLPPDVPAPVPMTASRSGRSGREVPIHEVDLDDWESPEDPVSSTGIMRIEDVTSPPMSPQTAAHADNMETLVRPAPVVTASVVMDDAATRPSAATRLRRPDPEVRMGGAGPLARSSLRSTEPPRRRSRIPMMAAGALGVMLLVAVVGGAIAVPVVYTQTDGFTRFDMVGIAASAAPAAPAPGDEAPAPASDGDGSADAGDDGESPPPAGGAPAESGPKASGAEGSASGALPPTPAPEASPPTPAPRVEAKAPAAEPASTLPPVDVQGMWIGSTKPNDRSLKITVLEQTDGKFEGTVDMQTDEGTFQSFSIQGTVDGNGKLTFRGNGVTFTGEVDRSGKRASGYYSAHKGAKGQPWSAIGD